MDKDQMQGLTKGYLPLSAFQHLEPTAIGVVDLDRSITPRAPDGRAWAEDQHDCLLLVRLHEEPLAVVYIGDTPRDITVEELASEIWQAAGSEIRRHIERFGCIPMPDTYDALVRFPTHAHACPGSSPTEVDLSVAVIVPTVGREEQLTRCVRSLLAQQRAKFEVIVVDNRPATGAALRTVNALAAEDPRVRYVAEWRAGSSVARNRGVSETDADLVAFTDDDVVADPSWLEWLLAPFAEPAVTATCGMVLPLELQTEAQKRFEQYGGFSKGIDGHSYDLLTGRDERLLLYPLLGDIFGSGNSMAFRRVDFIAAGGLDPALGGGSPAQSGEDIYAFSTVILRGGRLVYEPRSVCWHEHRKDPEALYQQVFDYGVGLGAIMTKALLTGDPRLYSTVVRSIPLVLELLWQKYGSIGRSGAEHNPTEHDTSADELVRAQYAGMLRGPLRYATGVMRSRKLGLYDVIENA